MALFERECSIQRRHQKIVEEAPSPVVTPALRARLVEAAVAAARAVEYVNAGTVEFVVDDNGDPYFLEMNTRLQVEHPVTEAVTGLDLVRLQLLIAGGAPLPDEVHEAVAAGPRGHAIEARLYAEDPPSTGSRRPGRSTGSRSDRPAPGVRVDSGVESGSVVSPHYDPMLAKVIVHAPSRTEAAAALSSALAGARIHGVTTNRDLLVRTLRHPGFLAGETDTGFLERHGVQQLASPLADHEAVRRHAIAAALAGQAGRRVEAPVQASIPSGFRNNPSALQQSTYDSGDATIEVAYRFDRSGRTLAAVEVDGRPVDIDAAVAGPDEVSLTTGGVARRYLVDRVGADRLRRRSRRRLDLRRARAVPAGHRPGGRGIGTGPHARWRGPGGRVGGRRRRGRAAPGRAGSHEDGAHRPRRHGGDRHRGGRGRGRPGGDGTDPGGGRAATTEISGGRPAPDRGGHGGVTGPLRIANCSGFYGDRLSAAREMVEGGPIDVLTGDWLAELTMLILWKGYRRDRSKGWAHTFLTQMEEVLGTCIDRGIKVVTNAGGLNPAGLADQVRALSDRLGLDVSVAHVEGDDLLPRIGELEGTGHPLAHLDTGQPLADASGEVISANAYLGGWPIVEALSGGADVVICPRITDASLVVGPAAWHHGWSPTDWDRLAGAVVAGHVIECGPQATGGNYAFFTEVERLEHPGFPIAEVAADGSSVITKHPGSGGEVSVGTVTAQLLYEIAGHHYPNTDVVARFDTIAIEQEGPDRVRITGTRGLPAPDDVKVCLNLLGGWRNSMTFVLTGLDIEEKAALTVRSLEAALGGADEFAEFDARLIRSDKPDAPLNVEATAQLRITVKDADPDRVGRNFSSAATELALAGYPGLHLTAPPAAGTVYGVYWPALVPADLVLPVVVHADGRRVEVPHSAHRAGHPARPARPDRGRHAGSGPCPRRHRGPGPGSRSRPPAGGGRRGGGHPSAAARHHHRGPVGRQGGERQCRAVGPHRRCLDLARRVPDLRRLPCPAPRGRRTGDQALPVPQPAGPQLRRRRPAGRRGGFVHPARSPGQGSGRVPSEQVGRHPGRPRARPHPPVRPPPVRTLTRSNPWTSSNPTSTRCCGRRSVPSPPSSDTSTTSGRPTPTSAPRSCGGGGRGGFLGVNVPEEYGGGGGGIAELAIVQEELAAAGCPLLVIVVSPAICATIIATFGTEAQKQRWLPRFATGELKMAFAITEPDAGSNSHNLSLTATKDGDIYRLNGTRTVIRA